MRLPPLVAMVLVAGLAGCVTPLPDTGSPPPIPRPSSGELWAQEMEDAKWNTEGPYSVALAAGPYQALDVEHIDLESHDGTRISMAVWRPDVPEGERVPVVLDVGPYYGDAIDEIGSGREKVFWLDQIVPHGFAYGRVAVRGTSSSGGCMEFFGEGEQKDIDAAVTHFGTQPWSNGNVALYGASYDGTTPWIAASFGNPHLKTIVPVSGLTNVAELMFRNGTSETRGPIMHSVVYWPFGFQTLSRSPADKAENFCEEAARGFAAGPYAAVTGERDGPGPLSGYWEVRDWRERVMANYNGSVFLVHGLQDWNVEPSMAYPFVTQLEAKGLRVKHMLGQWGHDWPDRASRDNHVRWDWAEMLLRWLDRELRGGDSNPGAGADVEDSQGNWRMEATWPPRDATQARYHLGDGVLSLEPQADGSGRIANPFHVLPSSSAPQEAAGTELRFTLAPSETDLRFAGLAHLDLTVVPTSAAGGNLYVELLDASDGMTRVAHGVMNLRYHDGGQEPRDLTPGEPVVAKIEFFPADVLIEAGNSLVLRIVADTGRDAMLPSPTPTPIEVHWGAESSVLRLPVIERDVADGKYPGEP